MNLRSSWVGRIAAVATIGVMSLAGCAETGTEEGESSAPGAQAHNRGLVGDQPEPEQPTEGGTLSYAVYSAVSSLDPAVTSPAGPTGGTEMAAVYDVLMRYDTETEGFVPHLAESMEESEDNLTWTLRLPDEVQFSDGTPFNADAVVQSIERYNRAGGLHSEMYLTMVGDTAALDERTVEFSLSRPWRNFPALLSIGHGMVVAPSSDDGGGFTPIGAGPFTVTNLQPQQLLELEKNDDYWGEAPHLDNLRFVAISGDQPKIEALQTGGVDMVYLRSAPAVNSAKEQFPGFIDTSSMTTVGQINSDPGRPGSDPRVRQAIAYAIDPEILNQRARGGADMSGTDMFQDFSRWHGETSGITPDAAKATELLEQAKADGYDGELTYVGMSDPDSREMALAIQAQLDAVGFDTTIEYATSVPDQLRRLYAERSFDLARMAYNASDIDPEIRLFRSLHSASDNLSKLDSPEVDAMVGEVLAAPGVDSKIAAINRIQEFINKEQPFLVWGAGQTYVAWDASVHGVNPSIDQIMLFHKAFLQN